MVLIAVTRGVSSSIGECELTFLPRQRIDVSRATRQHQTYRECLAQLGVRVMALPVHPGLPDAVFVEDAAVVVDEVAVVARMGTAKPRPEVRSVATVLSHYRPLKWLDPPATLEGGDVMRVGRTLYVGASMRTNHDGIAELREILQPYGYRVRAVEVQRCLHLKTGCSYIGRDTIPVNRAWVDTAPMETFDVIDVPSAELWAANALLIGDAVLLPGAFPQTRARLEERGFHVRGIDISELQKAEGGVSCLSLIFESEKPIPDRGDQSRLFSGFRRVSVLP